MRLLLAFDAFKESMTSREAADGFQAGFKKIFPHSEIVTLLLSDGGEGFVQSLIFQQGELRRQVVTGPLEVPVAAIYGWIPQKKLAVLEMATASGLELVPVNQRNPLKTTTYGMGELILAAIQTEGQHFYIGIGGSATVDGGLGMAQALGVQFFDTGGALLEHKLTGNDLAQIGRLDASSLSPLLRKTQFTVACDVNNPWIGQQGAARIFAPQKGATAEMVELLEAGMRNLAEVIQRDLQQDITFLAGGGAAGGVGGMLHALLGAKLKSGIEIVLNHLDFESQAQTSDLIVTGEGRIDSQTIAGKTISGIAKIAQKHDIPVLAIGGSIIEEDLPLLYQSGIVATLPLVSRPMSLEDAIKEGRQLMEHTGERIARMLHRLPAGHQ